MLEFKAFQKIPRLNRTVVVTEKIDGTNACVVVEGDDFATRTVHAQSRNRVLTLESDNYGFARWVSEHAEELKQLGPGYHYGEWWGNGIQRGYGLSEKRFSLFNTHRFKDNRPACCHVVPVICTAPGLTEAQDGALFLLQRDGSYAAPGFKDPEGIICYHTVSSTYFKVTLKNDEDPKTKVMKDLERIAKVDKASYEALVVEA